MISRLLLNKIPLWKGQKKRGVEYAPNIIEHMVKNIVKNKYPIKVNEISKSKLNDVKGFTGFNIKNHESPYCPWNPWSSMNCIRKMNDSDYKKGDMVLNIGGDHGIAIGTIPPMIKRYPNLTIIFSVTSLYLFRYDCINLTPSALLFIQGMFNLFA